ncbi:molybdopterin molybdenumtransferase MoeA [Rhodobacterales bacterium 52_120_T64]|nr:molybdopterin molybdenumtransferase MoeA [Rhodobacterales bacterium 52_120_T64]
MSSPPKLSNDCFALPPGVHWTPVDETLTSLRERVSVVTGIEPAPTVAAGGRVLAADVVAKRNSPPYANSAVDGYGFAFASLGGEGAQSLPLAHGRAAAGGPFNGVVPVGQALRILTGAIVPEGIDTIVLEEDVIIEDDVLKFAMGLRKGANVRPKGEDVSAGGHVLSAGRILQPQDLGLLAAVGVDTIQVRKRLRVAVLSTGDELRQVGEDIASHQIYDANRPMLLDLIRRWGMEPVDLGHVRDDAKIVEQMLTRGAREADVILTSGGASAGDEDHISAALQASGTLNLWRVAVKPGRPLALAMWGGVPVFGLPGNPVAAFVTALIFARPTLLELSGAGWAEPRAMHLPAAFSKNKKPGRREYLRAKMDANGHAEVFKSEGSGRISGLTWAEGLVELMDEGREIVEGVPVRFYPFSEFGL